MTTSPLPPLEAFAGTRVARACAAPEGAYANCLAASAEYAAWLRGQGLAAGLVFLQGSRRPYPQAAGRWPFSDPARFVHWTTICGGWSIDWTARQFDPQARWPQVDAIAALAARWQTLEVWACDRCPELLADPRHGLLAPPGLHDEHLARARAGLGGDPFPDPRHDGTPALVTMCACADPSTTVYA